MSQATTHSGELSQNQDPLAEPNLNSPVCAPGADQTACLTDLRSSHTSTASKAASAAYIHCWYSTADRVGQYFYEVEMHAT